MRRTFAVTILLIACATWHSHAATTENSNSSSSQTGPFTTMTSNSTGISTSVCKSEGYMADPNSTNCTTFVQCVDNDDSTYTDITNLCPDGFFYNPNTTNCEDDYECPEYTDSDEDSSEDTFVCTSSGRFPNGADSTCQVYYFCVLLSNGTYEQYEYSCPTFSAFDPTKNICTSTYTCPTTVSNMTDSENNTENNSTNSTSVCKSEGYMADPSSTNCITFVQCVDNGDSTYTAIKILCPDGFYYNPSTTNCEVDYECPEYIDPDENTTNPENNSTNSTSVCKSEGYMADPSSTNCTTYVQCIDNGDSTYSDITVICPDGFSYNPSTTNCEDDYECPEFIDPDDNTTNPENNSTNSTPICKSEGYMADPSSTNCTTFVQCVDNGDSTYTAITVTCPDGFFYNPSTTNCEDDYKCPEYIDPDENTTNPENNSTNSTSVCKSKGYMADPSSTNCATFVQCVDNGDSTYTAITVLCPDGLFYNPSTTNCEDDYECPEYLDPDENTTNPENNSTNSTSVCKSEGYMADPSSTNCTTYVQCIDNGDSTYTAITVLCPDGFFYNPSTTNCEDDYECPEYIYPDKNTTNPENNSTNSTSVCKSEGYMADPSSTNCATFVQCVDNGDSTYTAITVLCPDGFFYNPSTTNCEDDYECPEYIYPDENTTNPENNSTNSTSVCKSEGYMADPSSTNCTTFVQCIDNGDSTYTAITVTCPDGFFYNPSTTNCEDDYKCPEYIDPDENTTKPENNSTNSTSICKSEGYMADPSSTNCTTFVQCVDNGDSTYTAITVTCPDGFFYNPSTTNCEDDYKCPEYIDPDENTTNPENNSTNSTSVCKSEGYMADPSSTNCTTFVQCVDNGDSTYTAITVLCPDGFFYNPSTTNCEDDYECPEYIYPDKNTTNPENNSTNSTSVCKSEGYMADPSSTNCATFVQCVDNGDSTYTAITVLCPYGLFYNPSTTNCEDDYECPEYIDPDENTTNPENNSTNSTSVCKSEGYMADPSSTNCTTFVQCIDNGDSTYTAITVTCPDGFFYNPSTTNCEDDYKCPEYIDPDENTTNPENNSTNLTSVCKSEGYMADPSSTNCTTFVQCVDNGDSTYTAITVLCPDGFFYNPSTTNCEDDYECPEYIYPDKNTTNPENNSTNSTSVCKSEGYMADPSSTNCTTYLQCINNGDSTYSDITVICPDGFYYNPSTTNCEDDYECPEFIDPDDNTTNPENNSTNSTSVCKSEGYMADPSSTNCTTFVQCVDNGDSTYTAITVLCSDGFFYNPSTTNCEDNYECQEYIDPDENTTNPENNSTNSTSVCKSEGYMADPNSTNCTTFVQCVDNGDSTYSDITVICPDGFYYNPSTTNCEDDYECPEYTDSDEDSSEDTFVCTSSGRFPNSADSTCRVYYFCVLLSNGTYDQYEYSCPTYSTFDPYKSICSSAYNCPTTVSNLTDPENNTVNNSTNSTSICKSEGYMADPSSANCTTYVQCVDNGDSTYTDITVICPNGFFYNPETTDCEDDYKCPVHTDSDEDSSEDTFVCTSSGRFPNSAESTCQVYYFCVLLSNGTYEQYEYSCPASSAFDPTESICTSTYTCPTTVSNTTNSKNNTVNNSTSSTSVCKLEGLMADPSSTNCTAYVQCVDNKDGTYTEIKHTCPDGSIYDPVTTYCGDDYECKTDTDSNSSEDSKETFSCKTAGRFANAADSTCKTYYFCVLLSDGSYGQYEYTCTSTSVFDPTKQLCTTSYTCPF